MYQQTCVHLDYLESNQAASCCWILFFMYCIQHCFICRPLDSTVSEDAGIEPRTIATSALAVRRSNQSARSHPLLFAGINSLCTVAVVCEKYRQFVEPLPLVGASSIWALLNCTADIYAPVVHVGIRRNYDVSTYIRSLAISCLNNNLMRLAFLSLSHCMQSKHSRGSGKCFQVYKTVLAHPSFESLWGPIIGELGRGNLGGRWC